MDYIEITNTIFQMVLIPLLIALTTYAVKWINAKANNLKANTENEYAQKYIDMLNDTITSTVIAINQTYVDALKDKNAFDKEAQEEAFKRVFDMVQATLTEEANKYLNEAIDDLNLYITIKIEEAVKENKKPKIEEAI